MTVLNLEHIFNPSSVALIGASKRPQSIGCVVANNLFNNGFQGPIMPVNPRETAISGVLSYKTIDELPITPDLAVIATPPVTIPGILDNLGKRGTKGAVVITAGFGEMGEEGERLQQQLLDIARPYKMRLVGPNCLGVMVPHIGLNGSFVHVPPLKGDLAFVAQSGAVLSSVVDWATAHGIGFSHLVSLGDMADVDFGDMINYLATDPNTRAILLYVESITHARKFISAARAASRSKPVIAIKVGRSEEGAKAASSHTGALAGSDAVYDAVFRRTGILRVFDLSELFEAVETLAKGTPITGDKLTILTNGGGIGVLATDSLIGEGGRLAELAPSTIEKLNAVLPPVWSHGNPVDIIGDAPGKRYADALDILLEDPGADAILILNCPLAIADSSEAASAVVDVLEKHKNKEAVLTSWLGEVAPKAARALFAEGKIPTYSTPGEAVRGFMHMVRYKRGQETLMEAPASFTQDFVPDYKTARGVIDAVLAEKREWLTEPEAKSVLKAYSVPVVETRTAATPEAARAAAAEIGGVIAVKILSPDITHKSDVGGVTLNLETPEAVEEACAAMLARIKKTCPDATLEGFSVQQMAIMPDAHELIVGMTEDSLFGPVLLFGHGGTAVEVLKDQALALPPLNMNLAHEMIGQTRVSKLLQGYRASPRADIDDIALTLIKVSQLVTDFEEIAELDINPLLANDKGVLALDARIKVVRPQVRRGTSRLAISPYPKELEKTVSLPDGRRYLLRPIRPEDEPLMQSLFDLSEDNDLKQRFFAPVKELPSMLLARFTQIDYGREMALIAIPEGARDNQCCGIVRLLADPDNMRAEYGIMVRADIKGKGLGSLLMKEILAYAAERGIRTVHGEVLKDNSSMLKMCSQLGFAATARDQGDMIDVEKAFGATA